MFFGMWICLDVSLERMLGAPWHPLTCANECWCLWSIAPILCSIAWLLIAAKRMKRRHLFAWACQHDKYALLQWITRQWANIFHPILTEMVVDAHWNCLAIPSPNTSTSHDLMAWQQQNSRSTKFHIQRVLQSDKSVTRLITFPAAFHCGAKLESPPQQPVDRFSADTTTYNW